MKDNELHSIWKKNIDKQIGNFSEQELDNMLVSKAKSGMRSFYSIKSSAVILGIVIIFLAKITYDHFGDTLLIINNVFLIGSAFWGLGLGFYSYNKMMDYDAEKPLKNWLEYRINALRKASRYLYTYYFLFPVFIIFSNIAVSAFFDNLSFTEVVSSSDFIFKSVFNIIGSIIAAYFLKKYMQKKYNGIIDKLEGLYKEIQERESE